MGGYNSIHPCYSTYTPNLHSHPSTYTSFLLRLHIPLSTYTAHPPTTYPLIILLFLLLRLPSTPSLYLLQHTTHTSTLISNLISYTMFIICCIYQLNKMICLMMTTTYQTLSMSRHLISCSHPMESQQIKFGVLHVCVEILVLSKEIIHHELCLLGLECIRNYTKCSVWVIQL